MAYHPRCCDLPPPGECLGLKHLQPLNLLPVKHSSTSSCHNSKTSSKSPASPCAILCDQRSFGIGIWEAEIAVRGASDRGLHEPVVEYLRASGSVGWRDDLRRAGGHSVETCGPLGREQSRANAPIQTLPRLPRPPRRNCTRTGVTRKCCNTAVSTPQPRAKRPVGIALHARGNCREASVASSKPHRPLRFQNLPLMSQVCVCR